MDDRIPVTRLAVTAALLLTIAGTSGNATATADPNTWHEVAALPMTWIQEMSFVSARVGFATGGDHQLLRTIDGGVTWTPVIDEYPYYWYGVRALTPNDIVATAFYQSTDAYTAVLRWSHDGGDTWSDDLVLANSGYTVPSGVHFWNSQLGFIASKTGGAPDIFRTTSGGLALTDWTAMTVDPDWFGPQFSALPNGHVRISGIDYCESTDYAATWSCRPSIDPIFDGEVFFIDDEHGWVAGGGGIGVPEGDPPKFEGWVHVTTDGGVTWSDRTLDVTWPIESVLFVSKKDGWAAGGYAIAPLMPDSGGAYVSHDGGLTWTSEGDLGVALQTCATADYHLFCAGLDGDSTSHVFERDFDHIRVSGFNGNEGQ